MVGFVACRLLYVVNIGPKGCLARVWFFVCGVSWARSRASFVGEASLTLEVRGLLTLGLVFVYGVVAKEPDFFRGRGELDIERARSCRRMGPFFVYGFVAKAQGFFRGRGDLGIGSASWNCFVCEARRSLGARQVVTQGLVSCVASGAGGRASFVGEASWTLGVWGVAEPMP